MKIQSQLLNLQIGQQRHDELSHRDILCLPVQRRVTHMVLHFAKYSGRLAEVVKNPDDAKLTATVVDTFIICLAAANALNIKLLDLAPSVVSRLHSSETSDVGVGGDAMLGEYFVGLARVAGEMSKACESLDHLEAFDYRQVLESGVVEVSALTVLAAENLAIDLDAAVKSKWARIEGRSIFRDQSHVRVVSAN